MTANNCDLECRFQEKKSYQGGTYCTVLYSTVQYCTVLYSQYGTLASYRMNHGNAVRRNGENIFMEFDNQDCGFMRFHWMTRLNVLARTFE